MEDEPAALAARLHAQVAAARARISASYNRLWLASRAAPREPDEARTPEKPDPTRRAE